MTYIVLPRMQPSKSFERVAFISTGSASCLWPRIVLAIRADERTIFDPGNIGRARPNINTVSRVKSFNRIARSRLDHEGDHSLVFHAQSHRTSELIGSAHLR